MSLAGTRRLKNLDFVHKVAYVPKSLVLEKLGVIPHGMNVS